MKIMILCNIMPKIVTDGLGLPQINSGGWINGFIDRLLLISNLNLAIVYPAKSKGQRATTRLNEKITMFGVYESKDDFSRYSERIESEYIEILKEYKPDIIHVFGTELAHTFDMIKACEQVGFVDNTIISIQGILSAYYKHYEAMLPHYATTRMTLRDFILSDSIKRQAAKMKRRSHFEAEALMKCKSVFGRTEWDKACTYQINEKANYYICNEILRSSFYEARKWNYDDCTKYSIFVNQPHSPIKGFHMLLEAAYIVKKRYPQLVIRTTGDDVFRRSTKSKLVETYYTRYISKLANQLGLTDNVEFMGNLTEHQMIEQYMSANVYVSPSSIENSSNSISEAMMLGVPVIASDVGGTCDLLTHGKDGYLYPFDEPYMLAHYIEKVFALKGLVDTISKNAIQHSQTTHDVDRIMRSTIDAYNLIRRCKDD